MKFPKRNKIDKNKKIIFNFEYKYKQPNQGLKPNGFWYSCYDSWYEWCLQNMPSGLHKYIHKININKNVFTDIKNKDKNKLLVINNIKDFDIFNKKYQGIKFDDKNDFANIYGVDNSNFWEKKGGGTNLIKWDKVSQDFGGIEICPYLLKRKYYLWYNVFDVASGCVWNIKSIIKSSDLIYEKKNKIYESD